MCLSEPRQPPAVIYERPMPEEEAIPERRWLREVTMLTDGPRGKTHWGESVPETSTALLHAGGHVPWAWLSLCPSTLSV